MTNEEKIDKIKNKEELPVYFKHLTEIVFSNTNVRKVAVVESKSHQTKHHLINSFYKPICKIVE